LRFEAGQESVGTDDEQLSRPCSRQQLIPTAISHDMIAQSRLVMEASLAGVATRSFQASQQASTMAS
jgi:hypothetical protein